MFWKNFNKEFFFRIFLWNFLKEFQKRRYGESKK